jgi:hypothetical protein
MYSGQKTKKKAEIARRQLTVGTRIYDISIEPPFSKINASISKGDGFRDGRVVVRKDTDQSFYQFRGSYGPD